MWGCGVGLPRKAAPSRWRLRPCHPSTGCWMRSQSHGPHGSTQELLNNRPSPLQDFSTLPGHWQTLWLESPGEPASWPALLWAFPAPLAEKRDRPGSVFHNPLG